MSAALPRQINRRLVLEDPQRRSDGAGGYSETWTGLGALWAEVVALTGRTSGQEGGSLALQRYRISLRATPKGSLSRPRPGQRFRASDRLFRIETVSEADAQGRYLDCRCVEEVAP